MPSRWSSSSSSSDHPPFNNRYPPNPRSTGFSSEGHLPFDSPPNHPFGGGGGGPPPFRPMGGGGGYGPGHGHGHPMPMPGQKRGRGSPDRGDGGNFAKLFIGSVPRTATEEDIRPLFEDHGNVIEVALIKDKRTGQQQGCCFVKFATSEEADRAIRALHNQVTLPGGLGPIQVRYADGERERLGNFPSAVEYKLFVGSMSRQATEREVEEIFSPYGRVEDVYIMRDDLKQSRGCGFVKFSHREMAEAAIRALNGTYLMRGCDQPLTVRFADPKRPRAGESRFGPAFGGPGFGPRSQETVGVRPPPNLGDSLGGRYPPHAWQPMSPKNAGPSSQVANTFGGHLSTRDGVGTLPSTAAGSLGVLGGTTNGSLQGLSVTQSLTLQQTPTPSAAQNQPFGQKLSPMQKPLQSPQHLPSSLQLNQQQPPTSLSQSQSSHTSNQQLGQLQLPHAIGQYSVGLAIPSQPLFGSSAQLSISQPQVQQSASAAALQSSLNIQQQGLPAAVVQQHPSVSSVHQQLLQPIQQPPSQLSHILMQQQVQALQSSFQSSQQAFSQLQQQLHSIHPTAQNQQLNSQTSKPQSPWSGVMPQTVVSSPANAPATVAPSTISATPAVPVSTQAVAPQTCNWTEHTSPEGYKYYYNSVTTESRWEKPDELTLFEQQQQQQKLQQQHLQKLSVPQLQPQSQTQLSTQIQSTQQASQMQQLQPQSQLRQQQQPQIQLRQPSLASPYQASGGIQSIQDQGYAQLQASNSSVIDCARFQQGLQAAQEWMWKNKPAGT
ncbi:hypothetical protein MRB53_009247 [Persea americana]|uniref:Uncharacterized protein n=1 Tax=Persea americana TaxID=3435 RepID=A0ACC2LNF6_PERAE|nr:hypothetical protein MRB53_009247 [Persea americana]